jgi:hypothetical protein
MRVGARAAIPGIGNVGHCALPRCDASALPLLIASATETLFQATTWSPRPVKDTCRPFGPSGWTYDDVRRRSSPKS